MSDNEQASIDLSVNADAALQTLQELTAAAKEADATLSTLKTDMAAQVNQAFGSALGTTVDYPHAANIVRGLPQADIAAVVPGVPALQQQIAERGAQITGQAMDFTSANPQAAGQPIPALLTQFQEAQARQAEQSRASGSRRPSRPVRPSQRRPPPCLVARNPATPYPTPRGMAWLPRQRRCRHSASLALRRTPVTPPSSKGRSDKAAAVVRVPIRRSRTGRARNWVSGSPKP